MIELLNTFISIIMKMKKQIGLLLLVLITCNVYAQYETTAPAWAKDLIIYELSPKGFTSPEGPETGTFNSVKEKIPYLQELGITGVWFTGHNWADQKHFYNIWTQYASIRPDSLDHTLGTPEDFKGMVDEFHKHGIKVFLDIITHGVMKYSPLVSEKPHWFKGESWGMSDYDWFGGHQDLDDWWVKTHTDYVTKYGVDGYRLDLRMYRPDLWNRIKENAAQAGHPIVVFIEGLSYSESHSESVADFYQRITRLGAQEGGLVKGMKLIDNVPAYYDEFPLRHEMLDINKVEVTYTDGTKDFYDRRKEEGNLSFKVQKREPKDLKANIRIAISGINKEKAIAKIAAFPSRYNRHSFAMAGGQTDKIYPLSLSGLSDITVEFTPFIPDKLLNSCILSCHDEGWEGFSNTENPYVAEGSRCVFGYSCLFTPAIPIFMGGEEFNADYRPLPMLSYHLYDKKRIGEGKWLYGSWIEWDQLKEKKHQEMLADVKKMIAIRKQEKDVIHSVYNEAKPRIEKVAYQSSSVVPAPYILWNNRKAILIAGNNLEKNVKLTVTLPLDKIGMSEASQIRITDLWNGGEKTMDVKNAADFSFAIKKDKVAGGGLAVYKIEVVH